MYTMLAGLVCGRMEALSLRGNTVISGVLQSLVQRRPVAELSA